MFGTAVQNNEKNNGQSTTTDVFLYFTDSVAKDKDIQAVSNSLHKYQFIDDKLINPRKLLELPSSPGIAYNGGKIRMRPDNNVYLTAGNLNG